MRKCQNICGKQNLHSHRKTGPNQCEQFSCHMRHMGQQNGGEAGGGGGVLPHTTPSNADFGIRASNGNAKHLHNKGARVGAFRQVNNQFSPALFKITPSHPQWGQKPD